MPIFDESVPRFQPEKSGIHRCTRCLAEVPSDEFFRNDCVCDRCDEEIERYPHASTPGGPATETGPGREETT